MQASSHPAIAELASTLVLGNLLERVRSHWGAYELIEHWQQGEFHHDTVLRIVSADAGTASTTRSAHEVSRMELPGPFLVVATNCNGGVKEVLCFAEAPDRLALWHARCPENPEFSGSLTPLLAAAKTPHWFESVRALAGGRAERYRAEFRERQCGGGWMQRKLAG